MDEGNDEVEEKSDGFAVPGKGRPSFITNVGKPVIVVYSPYVH